MSQSLEYLDTLVGILSGRLEKAEAQARPEAKDLLSSLIYQHFGYSSGVSEVQVGALKGAVDLTQCVREVTALLPEEEQGAYVGLIAFMVAITTASNATPTLLGQMAKIMRNQIEEASK